MLLLLDMLLHTRKTINMKMEDFTVAILCVHPFIPVPQILAYVRFLYNHFHSLYM